MVQKNAKFSVLGMGIDLFEAYAFKRQLYTMFAVNSGTQDGTDT